MVLSSNTSPALRLSLLAVITALAVVAPCITAGVHPVNIKELLINRENMIVFFMIYLYLKSIFYLVNFKSDSMPTTSNLQIKS